MGRGSDFVGDFKRWATECGIVIENPFVDIRWSKLVRRGDDLDSAFWKLVSFAPQNEISPQASLRLCLITFIPATIRKHAILEDFCLSGCFAKPDILGVVEAPTTLVAT